MEVIADHGIEQMLLEEFGVQLTKCYGKIWNFNFWEIFGGG